MTRRELFEVFRSAAAGVYDDREAASVAWLMLEDMAGVTRTDFLMAPDAPAAAPANFDVILAQLRAGRPVQYIVGRCEFCGLEFRVREGVLIPRPETEELVAWVAGDAEVQEMSTVPSSANEISPTSQTTGVPETAEIGATATFITPGTLRAPTTPEQVVTHSNILDIGTGSGAIAVSLAARLPDAMVMAIDISDEALDIARGNAILNGVCVEFFKADALADPKSWEGEWHEGMFDVIVSNPPYIPSRDLSAMHCNVTKHEPHLALFVPDDDPLLFYRAIACSAKWLLRNGGCLYFEIYDNFADEMRYLLDSLGFVDVEVRRDINGKNRMVRCRKR